MTFTPWFAALGTIDRVPFAEAADRYGWCAPDGFADTNSDYFGGDLEEVLVHHGTVHHSGDLVIGSETHQPVCHGGDCGIHVVDGDLTVDGTLIFTEWDQANVLVVTGDVRLRGLLIEDEAHLYVGGALSIEGLLVSGLSHGGMLAVAGDTTASACLCAGPVRESMILFGSPPAHPQDSDRLVDLTGVDQTALVLPEFLDASGQWADRTKVRAALRDGRPVLSDGF
ncbi:hypothetical protein ACFVU0_34875 [Streptomyces sp. NPDC058122]|uniref:hypothetical protein n=1 Tax=Streptomyces sp. NPDC058122 TaxID=3346349 RepID=UPI0036E09089